MPLPLWLARSWAIVLIAWVFYFGYAFHEPWRDEVQTALVGYYAPTLCALWHQMRLEGVPPLVYVVMRGLMTALPRSCVLPAFGAAGYAMLAFGTYRVVYVLSERRFAALAVTGALMCTDTFAYEMGVVVRQYGFALGAGLACWGYLIEAVSSPRPAAWPPLSGALRSPLIRASGFGSLAALTSAHGAALSGAALAAFALVEVFRDGPLAFAPGVLSLPSFAVCAAIIRSYPARFADMNAVAKVTSHEAWPGAKGILGDSVMPGGWWGFPTNASFAEWVIRLLLFAFAVGLIVSAAKGACRHAIFVFLTCAVNAAAILYIHVYRVGGAYRHHLFLFVPALVGALGLLLRVLDQVLCRIAVLAVAPWFFFGWHAFMFDCLSDAQGSFSHTKAAARSVPPRASVVISGQDLLEGLLFWQPGVELSSRSHDGASFRYIAPSSDWMSLSALDVPLTRACGKNPDNVVIAELEAVVGHIAECSSLLLSSEPSRLNESFRLLNVNCSCYLGRR